MAQWIGTLPDTSLCWGIIFDIDGTLYTNEEYTRASSIREVECIAAFLKTTRNDAEELIKNTRESLAREGGGEITLTRTVYQLGISFSAWNKLREKAWKPEDWLKKDDEISTLLEEVRSNRVSIVFGTNAPREIGKRTLCTLGIGETYPIFGPESFGISKPDKGFFTAIAEEMRLGPCQCFCVGDRRFTDVDPALEAGFIGGVVVSGRDDLIHVLHTLLDGERNL